VAEIRDQTVLLDFNHPLAGRTLYFDVRILEIHKASAE
jgi:FKBP-type peptidyl-prolyl cis-trans isomerase 2